MIDVYISAIPKRESTIPLSCVERQNEIESISNERVRREKYYVWRLLEYAIKNSLGADASRLCFTKGKNGKWYCGGFEFSISHSGDALAVALSDKPVGIDVERIRVRNAERMSGYCLTQNELEAYLSVCEDSRDEWLIRMWCVKEAIFKFQDKDSYIPAKIEVSDFFSDISSFELDGEKYILAVATETEDKIRSFGVSVCDIQ